MWKLQDLLFTLCFLSCVTSAVAVIRVYGYEGREANVSCPYENGYESYQKYLCRNDCGSDAEVLITTSEKAKSKYSIQDDKSQRRFTATISDLSSRDAGKYWCGVTRTGKDIYTEVKLEVKPDSCCGTSSKVLNYDEGSVSITCMFESENQNRLKYICRGTQPSTCLQQALITSDSQENGRFRLDVDNTLRKFTVTITSLTQEDSGSYLCGVHRETTLDVFTAVQLEITEWCCVTSSNLTGTVGRPLTMQCPYPPQHKDNRKFLCKGDQRKTCTDMMTNGSRFTLQDDVSLSSFMVTIAELKEVDAGTYWCGSDSHWRVGNYTKIHLTVVLPTQIPTTTATELKSVSTQIPGELTTGVTLQNVVVFTVLIVLLLTLTPLCVLCIVYKCRRTKVEGAGSTFNKDKTDAAEKEEEVIEAEDIYVNEDMVAWPKQGTSKLQSTCYDAHNQQDDIYYNQMYIGARR